MNKRNKLIIIVFLLALCIGGQIFYQIHMSIWKDEMNSLFEEHQAIQTKINLLKSQNAETSKIEKEKIALRDNMAKWEKGMDSHSTFNWLGFSFLGILVLISLLWNVLKNKKTPNERDAGDGVPPPQI